MRAPTYPEIFERDMKRLRTWLAQAICPHRLNDRESYEWVVPGKGFRTTFRRTDCLNCGKKDEA
jgi:hypothetical protein